MKTKDVISSNPVVFCRPATTLHDAAKLMKSANCGVLPVLNDDEWLVGIITDRDICLTLADTHDKPVTLLTVQEVMTRDVHFIYVTDKFNVALQKMREHFIGRLPVLGQDGKLTGMLSIHSLLCKALIEREDTGRLSSTGENIVKTAKALSDRYAINRHRAAIEEINKAELPFAF